MELRNALDTRHVCVCRCHCRLGAPRAAASPALASSPCQANPPACRLQDAAVTSAAALRAELAEARAALREMQEEEKEARRKKVCVRGRHARLCGGVGQGWSGRRDFT